MAELTDLPPTDVAADEHATSLVPLRPEECLALLRTAPVGRFVFVSEGWPVALPVNFVLDGDAIVFRTAAGLKHDAVAEGARVAFEVDDIDPRNRSGWSVLVHGRAERLGLRDAARVATLGVKTWARSAEAYWVRVVPIQVTGRRLPPASSEAPAPPP